MRPLAGAGGIDREEDQHEARAQDPLQVHEVEEHLVGLGHQDDGERAETREARERAPRGQREAADVERRKRRRTDEDRRRQERVDMRRQERHGAQHRVEIASHGIQEGARTLRHRLLVEDAVLGPELRVRPGFGAPKPEDRGANSDDRPQRRILEEAACSARRLHRAVTGSDSLDHL
jgi:hypothetical protein